MTVELHSVDKRNGDTITFYTDWAYSDRSITEGILKSAMTGDCGEFLQGSAEWAMNVWHSGNRNGELWAMKVAADIRKHMRQRITMRATYKLFMNPEVHCTEIPVDDTSIMRLTFDKGRAWVWVKRLVPIRDTDGKIESVTIGAIWDDGIFRQLSRHSLYEDEREAMVKFNRKPCQQWADKRDFIQVDQKDTNKEEEERLIFPSIEEAERYERMRRAEEYKANELVNRRN
jgi:hypothetical protein